MGMGQNLLVSILMGWTSIYQLFCGSLGTRVMTHSHIRGMWFLVVLVVLAPHSPRIPIMVILVASHDSHIHGWKSRNNPAASQKTRQWEPSSKRQKRQRLKGLKGRLRRWSRRRKRRPGCGRTPKFWSNDPGFFAVVGVPTKPRGLIRGMTGLGTPGPMEVGVLADCKPGFRMISTIAWLMMSYTGWCLFRGSYKSHWKEEKLDLQDGFVEHLLKHGIYWKNRHMENPPFIV